MNCIITDTRIRKQRYAKCTYSLNPFGSPVEIAVEYKGENMIPYISKDELNALKTECEVMARNLAHEDRVEHFNRFVRND